jgi:hypothetical protein
MRPRPTAERRYLAQPESLRLHGRNARVTIFTHSALQMLRAVVGTTLNFSQVQQHSSAIVGRPAATSEPTESLACGLLGVQAHNVVNAQILWFETFWKLIRSYCSER